MGKKKKRPDKSQELIKYLSGDTELPQDAPEPIEELTLARKALGADKEPDLSALAGLSETLQLAAVEVLLHQEAAPSLQALEEASRSKPVRKAVRRSLHLLKNKGVVCEAATKKGQGFQFKTLSASPTRSWLTLHDSRGDRLVWHTRPSGQGVAVFQALINEEKGIVQFMELHFSRNRYKKAEEDILSREGMFWYETEPVHARWLIELGEQRTRQSGELPPKEYLEAKSFLEPAPAEPPAHPIRGLLSSDEADRPTAKAMENLHALEAVQGWLPEETTIKLFAERMKEVQESQLVLNELQRLEQQEAAMAKTAEAYFDPSRRWNWAERLLDLAHYLVHQGDLEQSAVALKTAETLCHENTRPETHPFALGLFRKLLAAFPSNNEEFPDQPETPEEDQPLIIWP